MQQNKKYKYLCVGLDETKIKGWAWAFTVGKEYEGEEIAPSHVFKLNSNYGDPLYVDYSQFVLLNNN